MTQLALDISLNEDRISLEHTTILNHDKIITLLESDMAVCACNATDIHDYNTRILQLEENIVDIDGAIQTLEATTSRLELDTTEDRENTQKLNITIMQFALNISSNEDMIAMEQTKVKQLEKNV